MNTKRKIALTVFLLVAGVFWAALTGCEIYVFQGIFEQKFILPDQVETLKTSGEEKLDQDDIEGALADFNAAQRLAPQDASILTWRGMAYSKKEAYDLAIQDFTDAIRLDPTDASNYRWRGSSYVHQDKLAEAFKDYDKAIELDATEADTFSLRGYAHWKNKELDQAIADYSEALKLDASDTNSFSSRGEIYLAKGDYAKAVEDFDEALRFNGDNDESHLNRGTAHSRLGNWEKARNDFDEAVRLDTDSAANQNARAWLLATCPKAAIRNGPESVTGATKACELSKWKESSYIDTLAAAYAEIGDFVSAVKYQQQAVDKTEDQPKFESLRKELQEHLALYQQKQAYREVVK